MVLSKSLILRFFCRFVGKNVAKFLCYIDLLKVTKLTRLPQIAKINIVPKNLAFLSRKAVKSRIL